MISKSKPKASLVSVLGRVQPAQAPPRATRIETEGDEDDDVDGAGGDDEKKQDTSMTDAVPPLESAAPVTAATAATTSLRVAPSSASITASPNRRTTIQLAPSVLPTHATGAVDAKHVPTPGSGSNGGAQGFWRCSHCHQMVDMGQNTKQCTHCMRSRPAQWDCSNCKQMNSANVNSCSKCGTVKFVYDSTNAGRMRQAEQYTPEAQAENDSAAARGMNMPTMQSVHAPALSNNAEIGASPSKRKRVEETAAAAAAATGPSVHTATSAAASTAMVDDSSILEDALLNHAAKVVEQQKDNEAALARCNDELSKSPMWFEKFRLHPTDPNQRDLEFKWGKPTKKSKKDSLYLVITKKIQTNPGCKAGEEKYEPDPEYKGKKNVVIVTPFGILGHLTDAWPLGNFVGSTCQPARDPKYLATDPGKAKLSFMYKVVAWHADMKDAKGYDPLCLRFKEWTKKLDLQYCDFACTHFDGPKAQYNELLKTVSEIFVARDMKRQVEKKAPMTDAEKRLFVLERVNASQQRAMFSTEESTGESDSMFITDFAMSDYKTPDNSTAGCTDPLIQAMNRKGKYPNVKPLFDANGNDIAWEHRWNIRQGAIMSFNLKIEQYTNAQPGAKWGIWCTYDSAQVIDFDRKEFSQYSRRPAIKGGKTFLPPPLRPAICAPTYTLALQYAKAADSVTIGDYKIKTAKTVIASTVPVDAIEFGRAPAMITAPPPMRMHPNQSSNSYPMLTDGTVANEHQPGFSAAAFAQSNYRPAANGNRAVSNNNNNNEQSSSAAAAAAGSNHSVRASELD